MALKFGTSGLRGPASELDGVEASRYALAFLRAIGVSEGECLIARDLRESSPSIAAHVAAGAAAAGLTPRDCGEIPTPALALAALSRGLPAIMVTGSHIPADRNGLKFYADGEITKGDEEAIMQEAESVGADFSPIVAEPEPEARQEYLERCGFLLAPGALDGKRIGVWQHSSVFRDGLVELISRFGAEAIPLGRTGSFRAVDTEAISGEDAAQIAAWVKKHELDALVSTDGDADRPLVADETGAVIRGDVLGALTGRYLGIGMAVTPVTSNSAIEASRWFNRVHRTRVGSPFVIEQMKRSALSGQTVIGFEANGGVMLGTAIRKNYRDVMALPTRDAVLPILMVLGFAKELGRSLSQLAALLPPRFTRSGRIENVEEVKSIGLMGLLGADFFADIGAVKSESGIDGRRFTFASGDVIHFRPSGNAPELRVYSEAATPERAEALLAWGLEAAGFVLGK
jgi:phosphomannomutase